MKKAILIKFLYICILLVSAVSQNSTWNTISVPGICSFSIPSSLEIQSGKYKDYNNDFQESYNEGSVSQSRIVAQPRGINNLDQNALKKYCRVILDFDKGGKGDYLCFGDDISATDAELKKISELFANAIMEETKKLVSSGVNIKIVKIEPVKIVKVKNFPTIISTYTRTVNGASPVKVIKYMIHNNDIMVSLEVSYRLTEKEIWEIDLLKIINTLTMTKR